MSFQDELYAKQEAIKHSRLQHTKDFRYSKTKYNKKGKTYERTPFGYDGQGLTSHKLQELLSGMMHQLGPLYAHKPSVVLESWPQIVGEKLAAFTQATRYEDGVLYVKVKNSTLLSLLSNPVDKQRIQDAVKAAVPGIVLKNIVFRIG